MGVMHKFMNFLGLQEEEEIVTRERVSEYDDEYESALDAQKQKGNVVSIHSQKSNRMMLVEPRSYEETQEIADYLRSRRPVIVNLQRVRKEQAVKIVDFLSGTVYALSGGIAKVGPDIFLCTPEHIEVHGTITDIWKDENTD